MNERPGKNEEQDGNAHVGSGHVYPDVDGQRGQEAEQVRRFLCGLLVQDGYAWNASKGKRNQQDWRRS